MTLDELIVELERIRKDTEGELPVFLSASAEHPLTKEDLNVYDTPVWGYWRLAIAKPDGD